MGAEDPRNCEFARVGVAVLPVAEKGPLRGWSQWHLRVPPTNALLKVVFMGGPTEPVGPGDFVEATVRFSGGDETPRQDLPLDQTVVLLRDKKPYGALEIVEWCGEPPEHPGGSEGRSEEIDWSRDAPAAAASFVEACARTGIELDYTPESLSRVDGLLTAGLEEGGDDPGSLLLMTGCYVGEVIRRHLGGEWTQAEPGEALPRVRLTNGALCDVMGRVTSLHRDAEASSVVSFYSVIKKLLEEPSCGA